MLHTFRLNADPVEISGQLLSHVSLAASRQANHHYNARRYCDVGNVRTLYYTHTHMLVMTATTKPRSA